MTFPRNTTAMFIPTAVMPEALVLARSTEHKERDLDCTLAVPEPAQPGRVRRLGDHPQVLMALAIGKQTPTRSLSATVRRLITGRRSIRL